MLALTKGAPDVLLARCSHELVGEEARPLTADRRAAILEGNEELTGKALRTLGVAFRSLPTDRSGPATFDDSVERDLVFLGLVGMIDPPAGGSPKSGGAREGRRHPLDHDHRRPSKDGVGNRRGAGHWGRRPRVMGSELERCPRRVLTGRFGRCRSMRASIPSTSCES